MTVGACGDLGTESNLGSSVDPDIATVFEPGSGPNQLLLADGDHDDDEEHDAWRASVTKSTFSKMMPFGLQVPGNLHIADKASST